MFPPGNNVTILLQKITTINALSSSNCLQMHIAAESAKVVRVSMSKDLASKGRVIWWDKVLPGSPAEHDVLYPALLILLVEQGWVLLTIGSSLVKAIFFIFFFERAY